MNDIIGTRHNLVTSSHKSEERLTSAPYRFLDAASYIPVYIYIYIRYRTWYIPEYSRHREDENALCEFEFFKL